MKRHRIVWCYAKNFKVQTAHRFSKKCRFTIPCHWTGLFIFLPLPCNTGKATFMVGQNDIKYHERGFLRNSRKQPPVNTCSLDPWCHNSWNLTQESPSRTAFAHFSLWTVDIYDLLSLYDVFLASWLRVPDKGSKKWENLSTGHPVTKSAYCCAPVRIPIFREVTLTVDADQSFQRECARCFMTIDLSPRNKWRF